MYATEITLGMRRYLILLKDSATIKISIPKEESNGESGNTYSQVEYVLMSDKLVN